MNPETEEKQKKSPLNRKFLLRGLVICVFFMLLPFAGMKAWKQSLYFFYKGLWEQNSPGDYIVYYNQVGSDEGHERMQDDELWQIAQDCLGNFGCEIMYSQSSYLPIFIDFNNASQHSITVLHWYNCNDLSHLDEFARDQMRDDCQSIGFEPITNDE